MYTPSAHIAKLCVGTQAKTYQYSLRFIRNPIIELMVAMATYVLGRFLTSSAFIESNYYQTSRYRLGNMEILHEAGDWVATHIEDDLADVTEKTLLISTFTQIKTYNTSEQNSKRRINVIYGQSGGGSDTHKFTNSKFEGITGFRQINSTSILAVDKVNHCIRFLDRINGSTPCAIGRLNKSGSMDGNKDKALFNEPYAIIDGQFRHEYLITDQKNNAIRLYKHAHGELETLQVVVPKPQNMVLDQNKTYLFVTVRDHDGDDDVIYRIDMSSYDPVIYPTKLTCNGITRLPLTDHFLVTHRGKHEAKTGDRLTKFEGVDMDNQSNTTICTGEMDPRVGNRKTCQIRQPQSIGYSSYLEGLVIGTSRNIRLLKITYHNADTNDHCFLPDVKQRLPLRPLTTTTTTTTTPTTTATTTTTTTVTTTTLTPSTTSHTTVASFPTTANKITETILIESAGLFGQSYQTRWENVWIVIVICFGVLVLLIVAIYLSVLRRSAKASGSESANPLNPGQPAAIDNDNMRVGDLEANPLVQD